jgi:exodeoxyribonuclease V beta subunit
MTDAFDLCGELPIGTTVLEASAGTGKTYTIAGLAARYVAEGVPLERLLLVTFTRMATGELRERVRERLAMVARGLAGEPVDDPVVRLLRDRDVEVRLRNLRRALADFDAATIATTHAFCEEMLGGLGIAGDLEPQMDFREDVRDLRAEVVDDLYVWRLAANQEPGPKLLYKEAKAIARAAIDNPVTRLAPAPDGLPAIRRRTATWTRSELDRRKRRLSILTFDDLVVRLSRALRESPEAVDMLQARYDVVLVDEFQDTDPLQWEIMRTAFGEQTLVLIGDPKQAIYSFRGADVYAYLDAAGSAGRQTLDVNHRSDQRLIDSYDALFRGVRLGHPEIAYLPVTARHQEPRLLGAPVEAPLRVRVVDREDLTELTGKGFAKVGPARSHIACDVAADIVALLSSDARIVRERPEPVRPGDIAVLVPTNARATEIRDALQDAGVPAVINGAGSVFGTDTAREWLHLLEALERPSHQLRAHAVALTCFIGWDAARVASVPDLEWERLHDQLHEWARVLRLRGVASLVQTLTQELGLPERILSEVGGERRLTDLRHIGQLLHAAAAADGLGVTALTAWLRRRMAEAAEDTADEDRSRRLESDAQAVQVLTVHRSKGLEFPIVYLPFAWDPSRREDKQAPVVFHDDDGVRTLDVSLQGREFAAHRDANRAEERGEALRLLYVALTRARHQAVVWWAGAWQARDSALGRMLFARDAEGNVPVDGLGVPDDQEAFDAFAELAPDCIAVEWARLAATPPRWEGEAAAHAELAVAEFQRTLDRAWRRTSYSAITARAHDGPRVATEPETGVVADEPDAGPATGLWADVPVGIRVGTVVHRALEHLDFAAPEFPEEVAELGAVPGLTAALNTPLGEPFGVRLADIAVADRLDELTFELPLAGGEQVAGEVTLMSIAAVLRKHDALAGYAERLEDPALHTELRGFLTGSLDLVARLPDGRFGVFDYKTNGLASFAPDDLAAEMHQRHYVLQALLYTVALHRYLRWRLADYDPARHLAGVGYLFLRGMDGTEGAGVFAWTPDAKLVEELSDAL